MGKKTVIEDWDRVSGAKAAVFFGVSPQAILKWVRRGAPRNPDRTYSMPKLVQWRCAYLADAIEAAREADDETTELAALRRVKKEMAQLDLEVKRGRLCNRAEAESALGTVLSDLRSQFVSMPAALAPRLEGLATPDIAAALQEAVEERIREAAENYERMNGDA